MHHLQQGEIRTSCWISGEVYCDSVGLRPSTRFHGIDLQVLQNDRSTSSLKKHLENVHEITEMSSRPDSTDSRTVVSSKRPAATEDCYDLGSGDRPVKKKQAVLDRFVKKKHCSKSDSLRLLCESRMSMREIVTSKTVRRLLRTAHPCDHPLPKSTNTLRKHLKEYSDRAEDKLRLNIQDIVAAGSKALNSPEPVAVSLCVGLLQFLRLFR